MREGKREAKQRQRDEMSRRKAAEAYWAEQTRRNSRGRARWWLLGALVVCLAAGVTAFAYVTTLQRNLSGKDLVASGTPAPGASASASPADKPASTSVFAGTPAARWPVGKAGITIPAVTSTKAYIPEHAAAMRAYVKKYLVTALLDRRVVLQGDMGPFLRAMGPEQAQRWADWLGKQSDPATGNALAWDSLVNRFHPGDWTQVEEPRVKGRTKVSYSSDNCVVFTWSYAVAYGFEPTSGGAARPVVVRRDGTITACSDLFAQGPGYVNVSSGGYTALDSVCGATWPYVGFVHAWPDPSRVVAVSASPVSTAWDPTDVDTESTGVGCFKDTSGFQNR